jgi:2'-5' RNA ligase
MRYALVVRLPRAVEVRIEDAFLGIAGSTKPVMGYHITLLGPCLLQEGAFQAFAAAVTAACRRWSPFEVRVTGLGAFRAKDDNVAYLEIADPRNVVALHEDLLRATDGLVIPQDERYREWCTTAYQPHVTLGLGLSDAELEEFLRAGGQRRFDERFKVTRIWLAAQAPQGLWQYEGEYILGELGAGRPPGEGSAME